MYNPFNKGRWYRAFVESSAEGHVLTQCDIEGAEISGNYFKLPKEYHILDVVHDINYTGTCVITENIKVYSDTSEAAILPAKDTFDYGYVYIFAHRIGGTE